MKFNIQDRIILDDMFGMFKRELTKRYDEADTGGKRPIITREYWLGMLEDLQQKVDLHTTKKALKTIDYGN
jgi:hypothetical protein